mmetsp:Transcript_21899/g.69130  ORF Transcript_21899/g.69130 Transcript_21899/m.69130 type:complete len:205 (+) Transcript_21899:732-1346(+)
MLPELGLAQQLLHLLRLLAAELDQLQGAGQLLGLGLQGLGLLPLLLDLGLQRLDPLPAVTDGHGLGLLEDLELLRGAAGLVLEAALRPREVGLDEPLEALVLAGAVVVLPRLAALLLEHLDGRVAPHAVLLAEGLSCRRAVHISNEDRPGALVVLIQPVPLRLQLGAVASPRSQELDKGVLALDGARKGLLGELYGGGRDAEGG